MKQLRPYQVRGIAAVEEHIAFGHNRVVVAMPTGMGKTMMAGEMIRSDIDRGLKSLVFTNRRIMIEQLSDAMDEARIAHGIRAAGYMKEGHHSLQIASLPTEHSRVVIRKTEELWPADRVYVDEGHLHTGQTSQGVIDKYLGRGAKIIYLTATPIDMERVATVLVIAGTKAEGRACGALIPAHHYGPDEPDLAKIGRTSIEDVEGITEDEVRQVIMVPGIFGRVWDWYTKLNPQRKPTILFAPGVPESLWFAEQFAANGVSAAHIDGEEVWINGETFRNDRGARERAIEGVRVGEIGILCNRFVLREGVDIPELGHGIFATVFSTLQSYLQSGGRLLRSHPSLRSASIQDHGGNWHRFGSLNDDWDWDLSLNSRQLVAARAKRLRDKEEAEPWRCPKCAKIMKGFVCQECGYKLDLSRKARPVAQADGTLKLHYGDIYKPRTTEARPDTAELWIKEYWRARNSKNRPMNFRQAVGNFFKKYGYFPPENLPLMPKESLDWGRLVAKVPFDRLTSVPPRKGRKKKDGNQP